MEPGEENIVGRYGWEKRSSSLELVAINILPEAREHKAELDLLIVWNQQVWKIKDCKAEVGEHVTTQHKPVVFVVHMHKSATKRAVDKARRDMEADVYSKLDEDGGKKLYTKWPETGMRIIRT